MLDGVIMANKEEREIKVLAERIAIILILEGVTEL